MRQAGARSPARANAHRRLAFDDAVMTGANSDDPHRSKRIEARTRATTNKTQLEHIVAAAATRIERYFRDRQLNLVLSRTNSEMLLRDRYVSASFPVTLGSVHTIADALKIAVPVDASSGRVAVPNDAALVEQINVALAERMPGFSFGLVRNFERNAMTGIDEWRAVLELWYNAAHDPTQWSVGKRAVWHMARWTGLRRHMATVFFILLILFFVSAVALAILCSQRASGWRHLLHIFLRLISGVA